MGDGKQYGCSRDFAASIGLVPRQYSTGGRANLLGISKRRDKNVRRLLVQCARVYMQRLERQSGRLAERVRAILARRHSNVVACALANKLGAGDSEHGFRCATGCHVCVTCRSRLLLYRSQSI